MRVMFAFASSLIQPDTARQKARQGGLWIALSRNRPNIFLHWTNGPCRAIATPCVRMAEAPCATK